MQWAVERKERKRVGDNAQEKKLLPRQNNCTLAKPPLPHASNIATKFVKGDC